MATLLVPVKCVNNIQYVPIAQPPRYNQITHASRHYNRQLIWIKFITKYHHLCHHHQNCQGANSSSPLRSLFEIKVITYHYLCHGVREPAFMLYLRDEEGLVVFVEGRTYFMAVTLSLSPQS